MNRKAISIIIIFILAVIAGNWVYGSILAKKIEQKLKARVAVLGEDVQLDISELNVNPILSKMQLDGVLIKGADGMQLAHIKRVKLDIPYREAMRWLNSEKYGEIKSFRLKAHDLSLYVPVADDNLLVEELILDFDGHLTQDNMVRLDHNFPETRQHLKVKVSHVEFALTPWMDALGFTAEQRDQFNHIDKVTLDLHFDPHKRELNMKAIHLDAPLLSMQARGHLTYVGDGLQGMHVQSTQSALELKLNKEGLVWGDPTVNGKFSLGKLHIQTESELDYAGDYPLVKSQASSFLLEDLSLSFEGKKKAQLEAQTALLGLDLNTLGVKRFALCTSLNNEVLTVYDTEIISSLIDASLEASVAMNALDPMQSLINEGRLEINKLQVGLQNALSTFELMTGQTLPRKGDAIILEMSGPVGRPIIKGFKY
ncbi:MULTISPECIES: hypothetical protein [unclassified Carboxylicivirga]|uniref:hypothetical protein n=1 Tax=Carboxylicivirga TaxID=1628153 RepID=UPI003D343D76